jgi:hypothetical protein
MQASINKQDWTSNHSSGLLPADCQPMIGGRFSTYSTGRCGGLSWGRRWGTGTFSPCSLASVMRRPCVSSRRQGRLPRTEAVRVHRPVRMPHSERSAEFEKADRRERPRRGHERKAERVGRVAIVIDDQHSKTGKVLGRLRSSRRAARSAFARAQAQCQVPHAAPSYPRAFGQTRRKPWTGTFRAGCARAPPAVHRFATAPPASPSTTIFAVRMIVGHSGCVKPAATATLCAPFTV